MTEIEQAEKLLQNKTIEADSKNNECASPNCQSVESVSNGMDEQASCFEKLQKSYKALQAEFTRKCQRLAELEKSQQATNVPELIPPENNQNVLQPQDSNQERLQEQVLGENWQKNAEIFFDENPNAKVFEKEILNLILTDKNIMQKENPMFVAYAHVLENAKVEDFFVDDNFVKDYVLQNNDIKSTIIADYVKSINRNTKRQMPKGIELAVLPAKPKTFDECGKLFILGKKN